MRSWWSCFLRSSEHYTTRTFWQRTPFWTGSRKVPIQGEGTAPFHTHSSASSFSLYVLCWDFLCSLDQANFCEGSGAIREMVGGSRRRGLKCENSIWVFRWSTDCSSFIAWPAVSLPWKSREDFSYMAIWHDMRVDLRAAAAYCRTWCCTFTWDQYHCLI